MIQGTGSYVGKSVIAAALCRLFADRGIRVAPFKAQNMALNSFVTLDGREMGRAQAFQAEASRVEPVCEMNPVLLKPSEDNNSQVVVLGEPIGHFTAKQYFTEEQRRGLWSVVTRSFEKLRDRFDLIVLEGAGSPAEINLFEQDFVNMRMAEWADAPVIIVGDINLGGVFAWMKGTFDLIQPSHRGRVKGFVIDKFRGERSLLEPGIREFEGMVDRPVLGVM